MVAVIYAAIKLKREFDFMKNDAPSKQHQQMMNVE